MGDDQLRSLPGDGRADRHAVIQNAASRRHRALSKDWKRPKDK